ncbi:MAG: bifunctional lysylphosphatidylglycerol synthetase/lysine--tRNA ligase LysX [Terracoccus sp.]
MKRVSIRPWRPISSYRPARWLTGLYAAATVGALLLTLFGRRAPSPTRVENVFGLLNIPVTSSFVSVVVLALITRALMGRKRVALWLVALFQVFGIYLGIVEDLLGREYAVSELWRTRGEAGPVLDAASVVLALVALGWLWRLRHQFTGRLQRGSWRLALTALVTGSAITLAAAWFLLGTVGAPRSQMQAVVRTVLAAFGGASRHSLAYVPVWVIDLVAVCAGVTILAAVALFLASARPSTRWSADREVALRGLLASHGGNDSLGYFATRRDKSSIFSRDGRAAVTYRVVAGVSMASADPVGDRDSWPAAINAWRAEAREFGWLPAVIGASEDGARAYASGGMRVLRLGDEAILEPTRFDLRRTSLAPLRQAAQRAGRAGLTTRIHRQHDLDPDELTSIAQRADAWRAGESDRGFSMALGRPADPADADVLHVTAHDADGALVGLLSFVPWGERGLSLDVMRRSPDAPNGVTELMITELLAHSAQIGIRQVSLNFCMFRGVFEGAGRFGSRPSTRMGASLLGLLDRVWQLERLYQFTEKFEPTWSPRFLGYDDAVTLAQVAAAAGIVEGFLPWPTTRAATGGHLDAEHLDQIAALPAIAADTEQRLDLAPRRSAQFRHRVAALERIKAAGLDPYPVGSSATVTSITELTEQPWTLGRDRSVVARVRHLRDHGAVVFVDLVDGQGAVQALFDARSLGFAVVREFVELVDLGDLVRIDGLTGRSRGGTPSLVAAGWRMEAKSLHPIPFHSFEDARTRARRRSTDLIVHPGAITLLRQRGAVIATIRRALTDSGFLEVETPMLHTTHGGASARPFRTHINAYGVDLSLRIAPELYLKRLLVGGIGPIFELGRNFRNEGADATHNPEFTSLEVYQPHADYVVMRHLTERLVKASAQCIHGAQVLPLPTAEQSRGGTAGVELVDISGSWPVMPVLDAVSEAVGQRVTIDTGATELLGLARRHHVAVRPEMGAGAVIEQLYAELVEKATTYPTFYTDFPVETSPLTHPHRCKPGLVERWDLVIAGMEVGTAYSELTDPLDQRSRLTQQSRKAAAGDPEAMEVDEDFLLALETGMPPSGGLGIGIDRLVMLVTNTPIRSVLTFPFVRPDSQRGLVGAEARSSATVSSTSRPRHEAHI